MDIQCKNQAGIACFCNYRYYTVAFAAFRILLCFLEKHSLLYAKRKLVAFAAFDLWRLDIFLKLLRDGKWDFHTLAHILAWGIMVWNTSSRKQVQHKQPHIQALGLGSALRNEEVSKCSRIWDSPSFHKLYQGTLVCSPVWRVVMNNSILFRFYLSHFTSQIAALGSRQLEWHFGGSQTGVHTASHLGSSHFHEHSGWHFWLKEAVINATIRRYFI